MNWLARLKKIDTTPTAEATEPTKPGFVGSVAPHRGVMQNTQTSDAPAANDPAGLTLDPDRWCWPHSQAMNTAEIGTFMARLARFTDKRMALEAAEELSDRLMTRDREADERRLCMECVHLAGHAGAWECRNWQQAAIASMARDAQLPAALVIQPQRCEGFKAAT